MFYLNRIINSSLSILYNVFLSGFAFFILLALISHNPNDPSLNVATGVLPSNLLGFFGSYLSDLLLESFGIIAYTIPLMIFLRAFFYFKQIKRFSFKGLVVLFLILCMLSGIALELPKINMFNNFENYGGVLGLIVNSLFSSFFKIHLLFFKLFLLSILIIFLIFNDFYEFRSFVKNKFLFLKKKCILQN